MWGFSKTCLLFLCLVAATKEVEVQSQLEVSRTRPTYVRVLHVTHYWPFCHQHTNAVACDCATSMPLSVLLLCVIAFIVPPSLPLSLALLSHSEYFQDTPRQEAGCPRSVKGLFRSGRSHPTATALCSTHIAHTGVLWYDWYGVVW